ncbi:uncharacterized protein LOC125160469 isoform X4 [Prionailurus viverrinus]|uniref:uncharacterized protein LOC125160469 isoform X4 n=1 Tax=Prionailurus viverrinus TaxID=61388 RepID=UPI001FF4A089|nr:uncharacterized protein LOC125160469 isoform X4 [Prionailurus viverrinus]
MPYGPRTEGSPGPSILSHPDPTPRKGGSAGKLSQILRQKEEEGDRRLSPPGARSTESPPRAGGSDTSQGLKDRPIRARDLYTTQSGPSESPVGVALRRGGWRSRILRCHGRGGARHRRSPRGRGAGTPRWKFCKGCTGQLEPERRRSRNGAGVLKRLLFWAPPKPAELPGGPTVDLSPNQPEFSACIWE